MGSSVVRLGNRIAAIAGGLAGKMSQSSGVTTEHSIRDDRLTNHIDGIARLENKLMSIDQYAPKVPTAAMKELVGILSSPSGEVLSDSDKKMLPDGHIHVSEVAARIKKASDFIEHYKSDDADANRDPVSVQILETSLTEFLDKMCYWTGRFGKNLKQSLKQSGVEVAESGHYYS